MYQPSPPNQVLIIGGGVLGLSTACALLQRPQYSSSTITILDAAPTVPNSHGASVDTSRVLRADYAAKPYTRLVSAARSQWQDISTDGWGGEGRYHGARLVLTAQPGTEGHVEGYLEESLENVKQLASSGQYAFTVDDLAELSDKKAIAGESGAGVSGDFGYVNRQCGWADAEACVRYACRRVREVGGERMRIRANARVKRLLYESDSDSSSKEPGREGGRGRVRCTGVELLDGTQALADLVIVAAGAWTPSLVDLQGRAAATGQVMAYLRLSASEQKRHAASPIYFNVSRGMFMLPPHEGEMKMGRHGFGYQNPARITLPQPTAASPHAAVEAVVSVPHTDVAIPAEAEKACREFLGEIYPEWRSRGFSRTRVCWYCDTPTGDFLIDYDPRVKGLFLATGDSGHAFKLFPVIGEKIADAIEGRLDPELEELWRWKTDAPTTFQGTDDGTRGGRRGMVLEQERRNGQLGRL